MIYPPSRRSEREPAGRERLFCLPGVYRPQADTRLLASVIRSLELEEGANALDICTGSGALAVAAADAGAEVTAMDLSLRAVLSAWLNTRSAGMPIHVRRRDMRQLGRRRDRYDLVVANPPYVPAGDVAGAGTRRDRPPRHCWDGGPLGRRFLDPLCAAAPSLLRPNGTFLLVQSEFAGLQQTLDALAGAGLEARIAQTQRIPFGPVMREQRQFLQAHDLVDADCSEERIAVVSARRTT